MQALVVIGIHRAQLALIPIKMHYSTEQAVPLLNSHPLLNFLISESLRFSGAIISHRMLDLAGYKFGNWNQCIVCSQSCRQACCVLASRLVVSGLLKTSHQHKNISINPNNLAMSSTTSHVFENEGFRHHDCHQIAVNHCFPSWPNHCASNGNQQWLFWHTHAIKIELTLSPCYRIPARLI